MQKKPKAEMAAFKYKRFVTYLTPIGEFLVRENI